ncbi:DUF4398 domain-containing protein [Nitrosomonas supralitoralis]|uniref:DUF4398 domain-containing protein n=1 Tax=Nitrosomonas supralitoralis TaxID=2116706 RepID=A0A2P7NRB4_9PROT|nr:DUF4398 domain-containing protein [Nitrosomonas supralitoralis]PSJ16000.1 hypothetical protein C7H79_15970 [Nitrosomonas supralitoralis]
MIQQSTIWRSDNILLSRASVIAAVFLLIACASPPAPPTLELSAAEMAITNADKAGIADQASAELREARTKLAAARDAVQQEKMILAQQLAEESRADAELAIAKGEALKAKAVNDELQRNINIIEEEMQRTREILQ